VEGIIIELKSIGMNLDIKDSSLTLITSNKEKILGIPTDDTAKIIKIKIESPEQIFNYGLIRKCLGKHSKIILNKWTD
jgi:hypothetical protein